jgi:hypothetical protein
VKSGWNITTRRERGAPMTSVIKTRVSRYVLAAAAGLLAGGIATANAADLGGNCCADLEERIAELEATTARKGNRKVSLTVSGWVNEAIFFWDDGFEKNAYIGTNSLEQTRFRFVGEAKIVDSWSAGYTLEIGVNTHPSSQWDQNSGGSSTSTSVTNQDNSLVVRKSNWWIKNKDLGQLSVGLNGTSTYHLLDDADGANTRNYSDAEAASVAQGRFRLLNNAGTQINGARWSDVYVGPNNGTPGQSGRRNVVRYDSPTIMGFVVTAAWGEDDLWDTALTYKGEFGDFKLLAKAGYAHNSDENTLQCHRTTLADGITVSPTASVDCEWFGVAGTIMHAPTGLYVYAGYGQDQDDNRAQSVVAGQKALVDDKDSMWFVQAGIEQKFMPLGKTTIFGEYRHDDAGSALGAVGGGGTQSIRLQSSSLDNYAFGVVQNVDAAAMDLYVIYRHASGDTINGGAGFVKTDIEDFDMIITGARIQF